MYDLIITGAGIAGLTAAIYGVRAGGRVLVLEGENYGGQIINTPSIENYPGMPGISGFEFASKLFNQVKELGVEIRFEKVDKITIQPQSKAGDENQVKAVYTDTGTYETKTLILATGAKNRHLGVEQEDSYIGKGVSYCATCDGAFFRNKVTAVIGGGNTALEDAIFLSNICRKVYLIHRRDSFRGEEKQVGQLRSKENVEFILNSRVTALHGDGILSGVTVVDKLTGEENTLDLNGLFVAVGQVPENQAFADIVSLDPAGYIVAGEDCMTGISGIFAAGDCRTKTVRQLTTAASDGAIAALAASHIFLE